MTPAAIAALVDAISPRPAPPRRDTAARPGLLRRAVDAVRRADQAFKDRNHLRELPDYLLHDIGLTRDDVTRGRGF